MTRPVLVVRHVPWEGPHRIREAFGDLPVLTVDAFTAARALPEPDEVSAAVFMGGPMSANDTGGLLPIDEEIAWIARAHAAGVPVLGVCLGSQLLARALGAAVRPAAEPEIGWSAVEVLAPADPLLGHLAPRQTVLHWHGEVFDLPPGAEPLARSGPTAVQAFRAGRSWGVLFHAEADADLVDRWLAEPVMRAEAHAALGPAASEQLREDSARHAPRLAGPSKAMFEAFTEQIAVEELRR